MEELLELLGALFAAWKKRAQAGLPDGAARLDALSERRPPPTPAGSSLPPANRPQVSGVGGARPSDDRLQTNTFEAPGSGPPGVSDSPGRRTRGVPERGVPARGVPTPVRPEAEAGLVVGLFANPQALVAAVIVAEVLAKPVALRDP